MDELLVNRYRSSYYCMHNKAIKSCDICNPLKVSPTEAAAIRSELALRWNTLSEHWEVYTLVHGSREYKWFAISVACKDWYVVTFPHIVTMPAVVIRSDGSVTV